MQEIYGDTICRATALAGLTFADPFAGSGVVSRLAKYLGFQVVSNDWEPYAFTIGRAYLETNASDIETLFGSFEQFERILHYLNTLPDPPEEEQYITRYYAPASDDPEKADYRKERLFYTRENALRIDRIRNEIDRLYPPTQRVDPAPILSEMDSSLSSFVVEKEDHKGPILSEMDSSLSLKGKDRASRCRDILIALLLYEAATHTNTSGVFKAYHRGFGGHGKDALGRILRPIHLEPPPLIDSPVSCRMYREEATSLFRSLAQPFHLVYLDPPYNQHQYGSNYHLLNTIVLWDKVPVPLELGPDGRLRDKAGIRKDWKRTKSPYCYRETGIEAFSALLETIDAEHLLISYSTDGIIPFETLWELCVSQGEASLLTNEYITYRGGKQSNLRRDRNVEYVLWVRKGNKRLSRPSHPVPAVVAAPYQQAAPGTVAVPSRQRMGNSKPVPEDSGQSRGPNLPPALLRVLATHRLQLLLRRVYRRDKLHATFRVLPMGEGLSLVQIPLKSSNVSIPFRCLVEPVCPIDLDPLSTEDLLLLEEKLHSAVCWTRKEELDTLLDVLPETTGRDRFRCQKKILTILRKLAHRKYRELFWDSWRKVTESFASLQKNPPVSEVDPNLLPPSQITGLPTKPEQGPLNGQARLKEELARIRVVAELRFSERTTR